MILLLSGRPLLAAQQCGFSQARLERFSRVAGDQGSIAKRGARLGLYLTFRLGRLLPGSASLAAATASIAPRLHDALLKHYLVYSRNAGDWFATTSSTPTVVDAHETAILRRLQRLAARDR